MITARTLPPGARLDATQIKLAREAQAADGHLALVASDLGCETEEEALAAVGEVLGLAVVDLSTVEVDLGEERTVCD